jgi:hypothetical protein
MSRARFSRWVFLVAGTWGVVLLLPGYFGEKMMNARFPPAINHPEYYYGFFGVALAWQIVFLMIAANPVRLRLVIPAAILEKAAYAGACAVLYMEGRLAGLPAMFGAADALFAVLFLISYSKLGHQEGQSVAKAH